ncbi:MAG: hypothetical protein Q9M43_15930 [Sulfurimonas sp.]|nr:hypothetical protein [Sulfurimonas sp.]
MKRLVLVLFLSINAHAFDFNVILEELKETIGIIGEDLKKEVIEDYEDSKKSASEEVINKYEETKKSTSESIKNSANENEDS